MNPTPRLPFKPRPIDTRIGYLLNRSAAQIREMAQDALKPLGLIPPHVAVISILYAEGPQTQRAVGDILKIDPTTMVWLIDELEKKGIVRRGTHPKDRRAHLVELSPGGKAVFLRAAQRLEAVEETFLTPLSRDERENLRSVLAKLFSHSKTQVFHRKVFEEKK